MWIMQHSAYGRDERVQNIHLLAKIWVMLEENTVSPKA